MRHRRFGFLTLLAAATLVASFLITTAGWAGWELEEWVETPEAVARTQSGECPVAGERCWELCLNMNGQLIPMGEFACMSDPGGGW